MVATNSKIVWTVHYDNYGQYMVLNTIVALQCPCCKLKIFVLRKEWQLKPLFAAKMHMQVRIEYFFIFQFLHILLNSGGEDGVKVGTRGAPSSRKCFDK